VTSQIEHEHIGDLKRRSKPTGAPDIIGPKSPKIDLNRRQTRLLISVVNIREKSSQIVRKLCEKSTKVKSCLKRSKSTVKSTSKIGAKTGQKPTSKSKKHRKTSKFQNARRPKRVQKWTSKTAPKLCENCAKIVRKLCEKSTKIHQRVDLCTFWQKRANV
jgi:hypothetical protein